MGKEIFVTNAGTSEAMSFIVAQAMQKLGFSIEIDRIGEGQNYLPITAENKDIRAQFSKLMELPEIQVLWDALGGCDIEESAALKECPWSQEKKARIRAFGINRRANGFMRDSGGIRKDLMDRAIELEKQAREILPEGAVMPSVLDIQHMAAKIVKTRLGK